jgi:hypothetical protein
MRRQIHLRPLVRRHLRHTYDSSQESAHQTRRVQTFGIVFAEQRGRLPTIAALAAFLPTYAPAY